MKRKNTTAMKIIDSDQEIKIILKDMLSMLKDIIEKQAIIISILDRILA